ncbi:hypothetical protein TWF106_004525 [Orbilia oligospora]|uniref:Uncharacterized protein n=1 Tax=Orbilia oligospora TaxID=2813651 RepID=A0A7C8UG64_ORBOL|nr:hypothetical protein TWF106_004525 [Orbilia oligospora]
MKTMNSRHDWIPCPLFIQAAHDCDLEYVSEHWNTRMRWSDAPYLCLGGSDPLLGIEMEATYDIKAAEELLDLKDPTPTPEELLNLIAVLAVAEGRRSGMKGEQPVPGKSALEYAIFKGRIDAVSLMLQAEPGCQLMALEFARKHHQSTIAMHIETWKPSSPENITEDIDEDIEMSL